MTTATRVGLLEAIRKYWWLVALVTLVAGIGGFALSYLVPTEYQGTTRLYLTDPQVAGVFDEAPPLGSTRSHVFSEAEQVTSRRVLTLAAERLGGNATVESLRRRVRADAVPDLEALQIRATAPTAAGAAEAADTVATAYVDAALEERRGRATAATAEIERYQATLRDRIAAADAELAQLRGQAEPPPVGQTVASVLAANPRYDAVQSERGAIYAELLAAQRTAQQMLVDTEVAGAGVYRFVPAEVPGSPVRPRRLLNAQVAALLGLLCSGALAVWWAEHRQRADDPEDARGVLGGPLLGQVPRVAPGQARAGTLPGAAPRSWEAVAYQYAALVLVDGLRTIGTDGTSRVVLVTGVTAGSGVTATAWNLGLSLARDGRRVVVVDADLRDRDLTRFAALDSAAGLSDAGEKRPYPEPRSVDALDADVPLHVVPAGSASADPLPFFSSSAYARALAHLRGNSDLVIVDAPSILEADETLAIAHEADAIVVVVERGCPLPSLQEARRWLDRTGTPLLGYVFATGVLPVRRRVVEAARGQEQPPPHSDNGDGSLIAPHREAH